MISALLYLIHFLSLHKSLFYPPSVYILYEECTEDGLTALEKKVALKEYKNEISHLFYLILTFDQLQKKCYYVSISTSCQNNS